MWKRKPSPLPSHSGSSAEADAAIWLQQRGLILIEKNFRCRGGEIDLIMRDGSDLVFVEVRLRTRSDYGGAAASVTISKQRRIVYAAQYFLGQHPRWQNSGCRFDVLATNAGTGGVLEWDWLRNAFLAY